MKRKIIIHVTMALSRGGEDVRHKCIALYASSSLVLTMQIRYDNVFTTYNVNQSHAHAVCLEIRVLLDCRTELKQVKDIQQSSRPKTRSYTSHYRRRSTVTAPPAMRPWATLAADTNQSEPLGNGIPTKTGPIKGSINHRKFNPRWIPRNAND